MAEENRTEEELLRMYIGSNSEKYIDLYRKISKDGYLTFTGGNISAFLFTPLPWAWYRKQYVFGVIAISLILIISIVFQDFTASNLGFVFLIILPAFYVNNYYIWGALRKIKKIESMSLPKHERNILIKRTGGTSRFYAVIASIPILYCLVAFFLMMLENINQTFAIVLLCNQITMNYNYEKNHAIH